MLVYLITGIISVFFACVQDFRKFKWNTTKLNPYIFLFLSFLVLFIIAGFRYDVGTDYILYKKMQIPIILGFKNPNYWQVTNYEIGFQLLVKVIYILFKNTLLFFTFMAFLFLFFMYKFVKENFLFAGLSVYIFITCFFYNHSFNVMRQALATAIFLYSIKYIECKNWKKFLLFIILATTFHWASLLYLPLYFFLRKKWSNSIQLFILLCSFLFRDIIRNILIFFSNKFGFYTAYFGGSLDSGYNLPIFILLVVSCIYFYRLIFVENKTIKDNIYSNLEFLSFFVAINCSIIPTGYRVMYMFFPIIIISLPYWYLKTSKIKYSKLYFYLLLVLLLLLYIYMVPLHNYGETLPYYSIFNV